MRQIDHENNLTYPENHTAAKVCLTRVGCIPKKSRIILALLVIVALGLMILPRPTLHYAQVVVEVPGGMRLDFLLNGKQDQASCERLATTVTRSIQATCTNCAVSKSVCLTHLPDSLQQRFSDTPLPLPSGRMENGTVTYHSEHKDAALLACLESERQAGLTGKSAQVACYPPYSPRPHTTFEKQSNESAHTIFTLLLGTIGGLISTLVVVILVAYYRQRQATQPTTTGNSTHVRVMPNSPWLDKLALAGVDSIVLLGTFLALSWPDASEINRWSRLDRTSVIGHGAIVAITLGWFWLLLEHYSRRRPFWDELREIFRVMSIMFMVSGAGAFVIGLDTARESHLIVWAFNFLLIPLARAGIKHLLDDLGLWQKTAVIIGSGKNAREARLALNSERGMGYQIVAFIEPNHTQANRNQHGGDDECQAETGREHALQQPPCPILLTTPGEIEEILKHLGDPQIIFALDSLASQSSQALLRKLTLHHKNIHLIPSIRGLPLFGTELSHFFSHEVLFLTLRNNLSRRGHRWVKRSFDLLASSALLILLLPLFLVLAILIQKSGGTPFYGHTRVGMNGRPFKCLKFRSMRPDAEQVLKELLANDPKARAEWETDFKLKNDPRITPVGNFLRKTSLDELPQLFNVLKGEMSLVGPRPVIQEEIERYGDSAIYYLEARPGITGLWQVSGRNDTTYAERINLDAWYVKNWSLWYDIAILFKTIDVVFQRKGAY